MSNYKSSNLNFYSVLLTLFIIICALLNILKKYYDENQYVDSINFNNTTFKIPIEYTSKIDNDLNILGIYNDKEYYNFSIIDVSYEYVKKYSDILFNSSDTYKVSYIGNVLINNKYDSIQYNYYDIKNDRKYLLMVISMPNDDNKILCCYYYKSSEDYSDMDYSEYIKIIEGIN